MIRSKIFFWPIIIIGAISLLGTSCSEQPITIDFSNTNQTTGPHITTDVQYPDWTEFISGIDFKQQLVNVGNGTELVSIVRFDPAVTPMQLAVSEGDPKTLEVWQSELDAAVMMNGSYFDEQYHLTTRMIVGDDVYGPLLSGKTAVLRTVDALHWSILKAAEIPTNDLPQFSIQSYPLLVDNGEVAFTRGSNDAAQRTVVALDEAGTMYWIIVEYGVVSLAQLAELIQSDLDLPITSALNLDGGTSTGMLLTDTAAGTSLYYNSAVAVPAVLYISNDDNRID